MVTRNATKYVTLTAVVTLVASATLHAEVCEVSTVTSETVVGSYAKERTIKYLKTKYDNRVPGACNPWKSEDAMDHWLYGDYWPLYSQFKGKVPENARAFVKSNPQPTISRFACWEDGEDVDTDNNFVGINGYELLGPSGRYKQVAKVDALCSATSGRGYGVLMLNRIADQVKQKLFLGGDMGQMTLSAVPEAMPFYNAITLSCNGGDENNYTAQVTENSVIEYKKRGYFLHTSGPSHGSCSVVTYGCESLGQYQNDLGNIEIWAEENEMKLDEIIMPKVEAEDMCGDLNNLPGITLNAIYQELNN